MYVFFFFYVFPTDITVISISIYFAAFISFNFLYNILFHSILSTFNWTKEYFRLKPLIIRQ